MANIDDIDNKLINLLGQDAWQRPAALARILHVSPATIRRRLKRLIQNGVVRAMAVADSATVALPLSAVIALNVAHEELDSVIGALAGLSEIKWFGTTTGQFDVIIMAQFRSIEEVHQFLQTRLTVIKGIKDSETFLCLHVYKGRRLLAID